MEGVNEILAEIRKVEAKREEAAAAMKTIADRVGSVESKMKDAEKLGEQLKAIDAKAEQAHDRVRLLERRREPSPDAGRRANEFFGLLALQIARPTEDRGKRLADEFNCRAMGESIAAGGATLVPAEFRAELIRLVEQFGVMRRICRVVPMARDTQDWPVRSGGFTLYNPAEAGTVTASSATFAAAKLVAKKLGVLAAIPRELEDDSAIDIGSYIREEFAHSFAAGEDADMIAGDGTSTYHGVTGLKTAIAAGSKVTSSYTTWATLVIGDFESAAGKLPDWADGNARWLCSRPFYYGVMLRLAIAAGGATATEFMEGFRTRQRAFLGYPVELSSKCTVATATATIHAYLGDFYQSCLIGERMQFELARSTEVYFATDQIGYRGIERVDFNCHSRGDASNAGGVIAVLTTS